MLKTESVKTFLEQMTLPDLAELYDAEMEVQVNVSKDSGEIVKGENGKTKFTDGLETWSSFRIPWNSKSVPEYRDSDLKFDLGKHVDGVGLSGWNWKRQYSQWVGFDFDAIVGHSPKAGNGLTMEQLLAIRTAVEAVPYVTLRASTSGNGLHVYVFVDNVPTQNHVEHAALAKAILDKLSIDCGFDLKTSVDVCGAMLWVWHRKLSRTNGGLSLLKKGDVLKDIPAHWKDYIEVISRKRTRSKPFFVSDDNTAQLFDDLSSHRHRVQLDAEHRSLIEWIVSNGHFFEYRNDHNMMITHTFALAQAHKALGFKGVFRTISEGSVAGDHNCYAFPMRGGAWVVRRYVRGTVEAETWDRDDKQMTRAFFNKPPDFRLSCLANEGIEVKEGGYKFMNGDHAQKAALGLGLDLPLPDKYKRRQLGLKELKDGKIYVSMPFHPEDSLAELNGWTLKKETWEKVLAKPYIALEEAESIDHDNLVRSLVANGTNIGWSLNTNGSWIVQPQSNVALYLKGIGMDGGTVTKVMGTAISKFWSIVNKPFEPEYPGEREWNRDAAQLKVVPSTDSEGLHFDHWTKILKHLGAGLDRPLKDDPWAKLNGITTGEEYLKLWIASIIKAPAEPLPYLFFFGNEDCGKSLFCEALKLLFSKGVVKADQALANQSGFNGELEHAILCYIEETDLSKNKTVLNRLKDYVTSNTIFLRALYATGCMIPNRTHWVQFANRMEYGPVIPGDTRIVVLRVQDLDPMEVIPKRDLMSALEREAADFLRSIMDLEIPPTPSRLNIPVIATNEKYQAMEQNATAIQQFFAEFCFKAPGHTIKNRDLYEKFISTLETPSEKAHWTINEWNKSIPMDYAIGKSTKEAGHKHIINIALTKEFEDRLPLAIDEGGWIRKIG